MVLRLANALDVPLRERNALLLAAGFAPLYTESKLEAPALAAVNGALEAILRQQEPFPAVRDEPPLGRRSNQRGRNQALWILTRQTAGGRAGQRAPDDVPSRGGATVREKLERGRGGARAAGPSRSRRRRSRRSHREAAHRSARLPRRAGVSPQCPHPCATRPGRPGGVRKVGPAIQFFLRHHDAGDTAGHHRPGASHRELLPGRRGHPQAAKRLAAKAKSKS